MTNSVAQKNPHSISVQTRWLKQKKKLAERLCFSHTDGMNDHTPATLLGEKLVLAVRADREESLFRKWTSWVFYAAMRKFAIATVPVGGFDYFLMDRQRST